MVDAVSDTGLGRYGAGLLGVLKSIFGSDKKNSLRARLENALESETDDTAVFSAQEKLMLRNILGFREVRVDDVMVPRVDIIAVDQETSINNVLAVFKDAGHSRLPVFRETLDEPTGMVHIKDLVGWLTLQATGKATRGKTKKNGDRDLAALDFSKVDLSKTVAAVKIARTMLYVPASMPAVDLLKKMQSTRIHLALVVDEYGGTEGLVSIEDLVEEIVGEIEDEHDMLIAPQLTRAEDGSYIADARVLIEAFQETVGADLGLPGADEDIDTLGGLVFSLTGRIPVRGELISGPGKLEFEIVDADLRRINKMRVYLKSKAGAAKTGAKEGAAKAGTKAKAVGS